MHHYIHSSTIYNIEDMETTQLSINRWINNEDAILSLFIYMCTHIYTYCGILLSHEKWNSAISAMWMDLEIIRLRKVSQKEKDKYPKIHSYVDSKIWHKWKYLQNRNSLTDFENRFVVARGKGRKGRKDWGLGLADANYYI